jgi:hypothetical protein
MNLTFKRREVKDLQQLCALVSDNAEAIEPGLEIVGSNVNLGRGSVELVGIDGSQTPVLITLGLTADDAMLLRALEAYAWCLEYPDSIQKLVPATIQPEWPPRVVFVAERLLESFVRKMRLLRFSTVDFFEFRYVEAHGTTGFYLDRVDWDRTVPGLSEDVERPARIVHHLPEPTTVDEPITQPEEEEPVVMLHAEPEAVPEEEPKVVMFHEPKAAPRIVEPASRRIIEPASRIQPGPPRAVEPAAPRVVESPAATNGAGGGVSSRDKERQPVVLKGLRLPAEPQRGRRPRDLPQIPPDEPATPRRETAPQPAARVAPANPGPRTADPRVALRGPDAGKGNPPKSTPARNGSRSEPGRGDAPKADAAKGDLAPTWRKFLDRLTGTFDARSAPQPPPPRASAPAPAPLVVQPFAADLRIAPEEVAPDEVIDEPANAMTGLTERQRSLFRGVTLPDNGELAPQWRKFLDHPTLDESKIAVVRGYLQREFPLCAVYDFYDFQRNAQVFQLQDNHGQVTQLISMTAEFFDAHRDLEIRAWIEKHRLAHAMRQAGQAGVLVSQAGLQIEKS